MTNMNINNPPVIDECQVVKTWPFLQNADGSLSPAPAGGGGGGGVVTQGTVPWVISGADGDVFVRSNAAATFPVTATTTADTTIGGTVAPSKELLVGGKTNDGTPQYQPLPLNNGGVAVVSAAPKLSTILYNASLTSGQTFTSSWYDTNGESSLAVFATVQQVAGATNFFIEGSTDQSSVFTLATSALNMQNVTLSALVLTRYWRVRLVSGNTMTYTLSVTASPIGVTAIQGQKQASNAYPTLPVYAIGAAFGTVDNLYVGRLDNPVNAGDYGAMPVMMAGTTGFSSASTPLNAIRIANTFKDTSSVTASGDTAVWTPATGRRFRVMRFQISVQGLSTTAAGGNVAITLRDATTAILHTFNINVPTTATGAALLYESNWIDLGNGYLSAATNNVLNINLGTAFTAGGVDVFVIGTEE